MHLKYMHWTEPMAASA